MRRYGLSLLSVAVSGLAIGWLVGLSESPIVAAVISTVVGVATVAITALSGSASQKANTATEKDSPKPSASGKPTGSTKATSAPAVETTDAGDETPKQENPARAPSKPIVDVSVDPLWIALFVVGIAVSAPAGIYARTARIFAPAPPTVAQTNPLMKDLAQLKEIGVLEPVAIEAVLAKWRLSSAPPASQPTPAVDLKGGLMHGLAKGFCEQLKKDGAATGTVNEDKLRTAIRATPIVGLSALEAELEVAQLLKGSIAFCSAAGEPIQ